MATNELVVTATGGTVRQAAIAAAAAYAPTELEKHAKAMLDAWTANMKKWTDQYVAKSMSGVARQQADPLTGPLLYPWWEILFAGPFQLTGPLGPFLPSKNFQAGDPAFMLGAIWMNPAPVNWIAPTPSAAQLMGAMNLTINFETVNLSAVTNGPDPAPIVMAPLGLAAGPAWFKPFWFPIGGGFFAPPGQGKPDLYEMIATADVTGPGAPVATLQFAGYSTWVLDPDTEPPFFTGPRWQYDTPARFLVYS